MSSGASDGTVSLRPGFFLFFWGGAHESHVNCALQPMNSIQYTEKLKCATNIADNPSKGATPHFLIGSTKIPGVTNRGMESVSAVTRNEGSQ